jgi:hypothetical protein
MVANLESIPTVIHFRINPVNLHPKFVYLRSGSYSPAPISRECRSFGYYLNAWLRNVVLTQRKGLQWLVEQTFGTQEAIFQLRLLLNADFAHHPHCPFQVIEAVVEFVFQRRQQRFRIP